MREGEREKGEKRGKERKIKTRVNLEKQKMNAKKRKITLTTLNG